MNRINKVSLLPQLKLMTLVSSLLLPGQLLAFERDHDAHEHGHSSLALAIENNTIQLEFSSPAINIVGFEHAPSTKEDKEKVTSAEKRLKDGAALFVFNPESACKLSSSVIESELLALKDDHHDDHEEHHASDEESDSHSEFKAEYHFECQNIAKLSYIDVKLIEAFPTIEEIETQIITEKTQALVELDHKRQRLEF